MLEEIAKYHVGLKVLVKSGDKYMLLRSSADNTIDLPGGRINENEADSQIDKIIAREVKEELGGDFKFKIGKPIITFRRFLSHINLKVFVVV
jgi:ADP-ribose pyrophosphatase YjhB (NUDIX family)